MPLYEYVCKDCGNHFEILRSMKEADKPVSCKNCFSDKTSRAISVFYAQSAGRSIASGGGCSGCSGGTCGSCGHSHN